MSSEVILAFGNINGLFNNMLDLINSFFDTFGVRGGHVSVKWFVFPG